MFGTVESCETSTGSTNRVNNSTKNFISQRMEYSYDNLPFEIKTLILLNVEYPIDFISTCKQANLIWKQSHFSWFKHQLLIPRKHFQWLQKCKSLSHRFLFQYYTRIIGSSPILSLKISKWFVCNRIRYFENDDVCVDELSSDVSFFAHQGHLETIKVLMEPYIKQTDIHFKSGYSGRPCRSSISHQGWGSPWKVFIIALKAGHYEIVEWISYHFSDYIAFNFPGNETLRGGCLDWLNQSPRLDGKNGVKQLLLNNGAIGTISR